MIKIGTDTKFVWICFFVDCSCLFNEKGVRDNKPSLEDCVYCESLRFKQKYKRYLEKNLKTISEVRDL